jgi:transposase
MSTTPWTAAQLQHARQCAITLWSEGQLPSEIGPVMGVSVRSVQRWAAAWITDGAASLLPKPRSGRPPKLGQSQIEQVLSWIEQSPSDFGFATERWTAPRVAALIWERLGVQLHRRYLNDWLRRHGPITPQVPERRAYERDQARIDAWVAHRWPLIKKRRTDAAPRCCLPMKAAFC